MVQITANGQFVVIKCNSNDGLLDFVPNHLILDRVVENLEVYISSN